MDTSSTPTSSETSDTSLTADQAGAAFAAMLDPVEPPKEGADPPAVAEPEAPAEPNEQGEGDDAKLSEAEGNEIVTVLVDGKPVELTKAQIAENVKAGLRQADYTQKTQALAEEKKTAAAEQAKARAERDQYAQGLQRAAAMLEGQLQEQQKIDWERLLQQDPVEFLKQKHLAETRQAQLQQTYQQKQQLDAQSQAEHQAALKAHVESQREELIAKIPEWKDEAKRTQGASELRDYLKTQGLTEAEIFSVTDHRAIVQSYKAMKYDQMMSKATAAAKKMQNTPQRVERPQGGDTQPLDKRTAAYQRLSKTGSVEAAGSVFASMLT